MRQIRVSKGQSSTEFFIITGIVIFFFLTFSIIIQTNTIDKNLEIVNFKVKELALGIQDEISLATESSEGYRRDFSIQDKISGKDYEINITEGYVYVRTNDGKFALALPVSNVTGDVRKGDNFIMKSDGKVYLNVQPGLSPPSPSPSPSPS